MAHTTRMRVPQWAVTAGCVHTNAQGVFLKLWGEVGGLRQAEDVAFQHVPAHLIVEGVTKLRWNLQEVKRLKSTHVHSAAHAEPAHLPAFCPRYYRC